MNPVSESKSMTPQDIKKIRQKLDVDQGQLAVMLAVNKSTVSRWEMGSATPTGDSARRLEKLKEVIRDKNDLKEFKKVLTLGGGLVAASAILGMGSTISGVAAGIIGVSRLFGPAGVLAGAGGYALYKTLKTLFEEDGS